MFKRFWIIKACQEDTVFKAGVFFYFFIKVCKNSFIFLKSLKGAVERGNLLIW